MKRRQAALLVEIVALVLIAVAIAVTAVALPSSVVFGGNGGVGIGEPQTASGQNGEPDYVLPESDSRFYSKEELDELSTWDLYIAHNELYARHGREFEREDLTAHFKSRTWYEPLYAPEEFDALPSPLNEFEQANSELLFELRNERNDPNL